MLGDVDTPKWRWVEVGLPSIWPRWRSEAKLELKVSLSQGCGFDPEEQGQADTIVVAVQSRIEVSQQTVMVQPSQVQGGCYVHHD